jgi:type II secretion system protein N
MKKTAVILAICLFLVWGLWLLFIPEDFIIDSIENSLIKSGLKIGTDGFQKGLFYNFSINDLNITDRNNRLILAISDVKARLDISSVVRLDPAVDFLGNITGGNIYGNISVMDSDGASNIKGSGIDIFKIPALGQLGLKGKGNLSFDLLHNNNRSEIKFSVYDINMNASFSGAGFLPLKIFQKARGALVIEKKTVSVTSFAAEGEGIYIRVKGDIGRNNQNLKIEMMIDPSPRFSPLFLAAIEQFKVSPGYYVIPPSYFKIPGY